MISFLHFRDFWNVPSVPTCAYFWGTVSENLNNREAHTVANLFTNIFLLWLKKAFDVILKGLLEGTNMTNEYGGQRCILCDYWLRWLHISVN